MRGSARRPGSRNADRQREAVHARNLRYRIEIEMLPKSGALRVADEYLAPLTTRGEPSRRRPFLERQGDKLLMRREGGTHVTHHHRFLDHSILSMPHYPPHHPHLVAARHELESWLFLCFEPRERMRTANPLKEGRRIGPRGEDLAAFLNTVKAEEPELFGCVEAELTAMMPRFDGIRTEVNELGEVELRLGPPADYPYDCATPRPRLVRVRDPFGKLLAKSLLVKSRVLSAYAISASAVQAAAEDNPGAEP